VSYDCIAGPSEMITDGENGYLIPVFNDELFQEKLQLLIDNDALLNKMSATASQSVKEFEIERIGKEYFSFITSNS
jgi:GalNAc-alpha-(1->4)-GalNAc-alpha-(1->3)-diNAcBac-PP-undecaprenol alpha-1,4-N-acetyl-D-galactosaminyltransferase